MEKMNARRLIVLLSGVLGAALLLAGVIGLLVPVSVSDDNGGSIGCGNVVASDDSGARSANDKANQKSGANIPVIGPVLGQIVQHPDYVAKCDSARQSQGKWSIPLTVIGILVAGGAVLAEVLARRPQRATSGGGPLVNAP